MGDADTAWVQFFVDGGYYDDKGTNNNRVRANSGVLAFGNGDYPITRKQTTGDEGHGAPGNSPSVKKRVSPLPATAGCRV